MPKLLLQAHPAIAAALTQEEIDIVQTTAPEPRQLRVHVVGHMIHDEKPADFLQAIDTFLINPIITR
jgi:pimeloyl-ACP methyl ester carboxylesterase